MAKSVETKILDGLTSHFDGLVLPTGVRVARPNVSFVPDGKPYVRISIHKNTPQGMFITGNREPVRMGFMLATVCWPAGAGLNLATDLAAQIRDHFAFDDAHSGRRIINYEGIKIYIGLDQEVSVNSDIQGTAYSEIPVVIPWKVIP